MTVFGVPTPRHFSARQGVGRVPRMAPVYSLDTRGGVGDVTSAQMSNRQCENVLPYNSMSLTGILMVLKTSVLDIGKHIG